MKEEIAKVVDQVLEDLGIPLETWTLWNVIDLGLRSATDMPRIASYYSGELIPWHSRSSSDIASDVQRCIESSIILVVDANRRADIINRLRCDACAFYLSHVPKIGEIDLTDKGASQYMTAINAIESSGVHIRRDWWDFVFEYRIAMSVRLWNDLERQHRAQSMVMVSEQPQSQMIVAMVPSDVFDELPTGNEVLVLASIRHAIFVTQERADTFMEEVELKSWKPQSRVEIGKWCSSWWDQHDHGWLVAYEICE